MSIILPEGIVPEVTEWDSIEWGNRYPFGLLVNEAGEPAASLDEAVRVVHAQIMSVSRGKEPGDWFRRADREQAWLQDVMDAHPDGILIIPTHVVKANADRLTGKQFKILSCRHVHPDSTGFNVDWVWGDLRPRPQTGASCSYCDNGECLRRSATNRNSTWSVGHKYNDLTTCGEASKEWKKTAAQRAAEEARKEEQERKAREEAAKKEAAARKRQTTKRERVMRLAEEGKTEGEREAAREALRRMDAAQAKREAQEQAVA